MAGYDPNLMNQARQSMGLAPLGGAPGVQPLTPDEQAMAQEQALRLDMQDAYAAASPVHQGDPITMPQPQGLTPSIPLDWQPQQPQAVQFAPPPPRQDAAPSPGPTAARMPAMGGGARMPASPIGGMLKDATARRQEAESGMRSAEIGGDMATTNLQQSAEDLGQVHARNASEVAGVQQRSAREGEAYQRQLADQQDSYHKASAKAESEQRQIGEFISGYQPKDRRSMGQRVMSALAVVTASLLDQVNLVAGMNMGAPVQTDHGARAADLVQRGIDRDIDMQRQMLDNKRTALAAKGTELGQLRERFGDGVDTLRLARAMKIEQAQQEIEAAKSRGMSQEAGVIADQTIAALEQQRQNELMSVSADRFKQHYAQEQALKQAQYQQTLAGRPKVMSTKEALDLEGKALDNAKKRQELGGDGEKPLTPEQKKRQSLFTGKDQAANVIARAVASGDAAPSMFGRMAEGTVLRGEKGDEMDTAIAAMKDVLLRDESGASISEGDKASKVDAWGLERGGEARKRGLRMMLDEYNARRESVGLDSLKPVVRRGAAR